MPCALSTRALSPFGLEVELDLCAPMSVSTVAQLRVLFAEYHLLLFRKQSMPMDQQIKVAKRFGPVVSVNGFTVGEYISNCRPDGALGSAEICFHSDLSYSRYPYQAVMMQATDLVDGASSTRFASGMLAYDLLPEAMRAELYGLSALLVWPLHPGRRNRNSEVATYYPRAVQPVLWTHPTTGRQGLYLEPNATDSILGLPPEKSEDLLQALWSYELAAENVYEHRWHVGDTIIWDNMALLHARGDVSQVGRRTLQRVTIAEKGYVDIFPMVEVKNSLGKLDPTLDRARLAQAN